LLKFTRMQQDYRYMTPTAKPRSYSSDFEPDSPHPSQVVSPLPEQEEKMTKEAPKWHKWGLIAIAIIYVAVMADGIRRPSISESGLAAILASAVLA